MTIRMRTVVGKINIVYVVLDRDGNEVWRREVPITQKEAERAGGNRATRAARDQERVALTLAEKGEVFPRGAHREQTRH